MSWLGKLKGSLSKSSSKLQEGIANIFTKRPLDQAMLDQLEELLIESDMGVSVATDLVENFSRERFGKEVAPEEVRAALAGQVAELLTPVAKPLEIDPALKPHVVLVVGVNGNGKTTTIGKLASKLKAEGKSVMLAAADTFRAAAVEQLGVWAERCDLPLVKGAHEADPASVAYQALEQARAKGVDVLMVDTAGRLQNKANLMAELEKIIRVMKKLDEHAPHTVLQVLDATTGQNALSQVETFRQMVGVTGLIVTKLDGTAKGGVVVALAKKFGLPVHAIGVGEGIEDLNSFQASDFAAGLMEQAARAA